MPVHKKHATTTPKSGATPDILPSDQSKPLDFYQSLRAEIRAATRTVMEEIMRKELSQFLGASWGERTTQRKGYRKGFYTRDLLSSAGPIEDLTVPRDRAGEFHTQAFELYSRDAPQVARPA